MPTFDLSTGPHRTRRLSAYGQWELLQAIAPALGIMTELAYGLRMPGADAKVAAELFAPLASLSEEQITAVIQASCGACERQADEKAWVPVDQAPRLADLTIMLMVVVNEHFAKLFALERPKFNPTEPPYRYVPVSMPGGRDWLYRPFTDARSRSDFYRLHDGTLQLWQIADMNSALDVRDENEARARKAAEAVK